MLQDTQIVLPFARLSGMTRRVLFSGNFIACTRRETSPV